MKVDRVYIRDILDRIDRILEFTVGGQDTFLESTLIQDAVLRNFEVIGEAVKRVSDDLRAKHPDIVWRKIAGFRDVLIHRYDDILLEEVWAVIEKDLSDLRTKLTTILHGIESDSD